VKNSFCLLREEASRKVGYSGRATEEGVEQRMFRRLSFFQERGEKISKDADDGGYSGRKGRERGSSAGGRGRAFHQEDSENEMSQRNDGRRTRPDRTVQAGLWTWEGKGGKTVNRGGKKNRGQKVDKRVLETSAKWGGAHKRKKKRRIGENKRRYVKKKKKKSAAITDKYHRGEKLVSMCRK